MKLQTQRIVVPSEAPLHDFLHVRHLFLFQVAAQRVEDAVDCSGILHSTPAVVDGQRCQNPLLFPDQLR